MTDFRDGSFPRHERLKDVLRACFIVAIGGFYLGAECVGEVGKKFHVPGFMNFLVTHHERRIGRTTSNWVRANGFVA